MTAADAASRKLKTMWFGVAGCIASVGLVELYPMVNGSGSSLMGEVHAGAGEAFITECMEAALMWSHDSLDFRLAATSQERTALRGKCSAAYARGETTPEMIAVRDGSRIVRDGKEGVTTSSVF